MRFHKFYLLILILFLFSCSVQNKTIKNKSINTEFNENYKASRKAFRGKLNITDYKEIRELILSELKTEIPENKAILINYYQNGTNCYEYGLNKNEGKIVTENGIRISARISKELNTSDFFVYTSDNLNKERYENRANFILDSGFFSTTFFTLKENCRAFFILKPNGEFLKYYGSDYFSEVEYFLQIK